MTGYKLKPPERLRSKDTLRRPYQWFRLDSKSKQDKVKVTYWKNLPKIMIFEICKKKRRKRKKPYTRHTFWSTLIRCVNMKWIWQVLFMMTSSNGNIFRVTGHLCGEFTGPGEFPAQRPVTRSFDVFFDLRLNKRLSKQSWGWWFETPSCPLWRHSNVKIPSGHDTVHRRTNGQDIPVLTSLKRVYN